MTRLEYLKSLEGHLKGRLSREEINEIMRDYGEYFTEGERQGKTDWEMFITLGDPKDTAQQIISESGAQQKFAGAAHYAAETARTAAQGVGSAVKSAGSTTWKIILIVALVLFSPVLLGAAAGALGILLSIFACIVGLIVGCGAVSLGGVALLVMGCMVASTLPVTATALVIVVSIGLVAGGILGICLMLLIGRLLWRFCLWLFQWGRVQIGASPIARPAVSRPAASAAAPPAPPIQPQPETEAEAPTFSDTLSETLSDKDDQYPRGGDNNA